MQSQKYNYYDIFVETLIEKGLLIQQEKYNIKLIEEIINSIFLDKTYYFRKEEFYGDRN